MVAAGPLFTGAGWPGLVRRGHGHAVRASCAIDVDLTIPIRPLNADPPHEEPGHDHKGGEVHDDPEALTVRQDSPCRSPDTP
ncbi:hypothetical protein GCM10010397_51100 [Streptomyces spinoverrucosus]|nr:hypothetical protein GCM10010397_51100 [Streptomyces spinoverrucosus]